PILLLLLSNHGFNDSGDFRAGDRFDRGSVQAGSSAHNGDRRAARDRGLRNPNSRIHEPATLAYWPHVLVLRNRSASSQARLSCLLRRFPFLFQLVLRGIRRTNRTAETRNQVAADRERNRRLPETHRRAGAFSFGSAR